MERALELSHPGLSGRQGGQALHGILPNRHDPGLHEVVSGSPWSTWPTTRPHGRPQPLMNFLGRAGPPPSPYLVKAVKARIPRQACRAAFP